MMAASKKSEAPAPTLAEAAPHVPTEVERALAEQDLDQVIATMLSKRQRASMAAAPQLAPQPSLAAESVAYGAAPMARSVARNDDLADAESVDSASVNAVLGRVNQDGFWDFRPAAMALNRRDWNSASRELEAASIKAPEPAERSFANSALRLLSSPGQPLASRNFNLSDNGSLAVQSAGRWQYFVDNHVARYSGGVVARMPGLRSEGNELITDVAFDRASFSPGTRFIRLSDENSSSVAGPQGEAVSEPEFNAPRGADYLLRAKQLRLK